MLIALFRKLTARLWIDDAPLKDEVFSSIVSWLNIRRNGSVQVVRISGAWSYCNPGRWFERELIIRRRLIFSNV